MNGEPAAMVASSSMVLRLCPCEVLDEFAAKWNLRISTASDVRSCDDKTALAAARDPRPRPEPKAGRSRRPAVAF
eukprot:2708426-Heterocapsa_arctica.AAC.2